MKTQFKFMLVYTLITKTMFCLLLMPYWLFLADLDMWYLGFLGILPVILGVIYLYLFGLEKIIKKSEIKINKIENKTLVKTNL